MGAGGGSVGDGAEFEGGGAEGGVSGCGLLSVGGVEGGGGGCRVAFWEDGVDFVRFEREGVDQGQIQGMSDQAKLDGGRTQGGNPAAVNRTRCHGSSEGCVSWDVEMLALCRPGPASQYPVGIQQAVLKDCRRYCPSW